MKPIKIEVSLTVEEAHSAFNLLAYNDNNGDLQFALCDKLIGHVPGFGSILYADDQWDLAQSMSGINLDLLDEIDGEQYRDGKPRHEWAQEY